MDKYIEIQKKVVEDYRITLAPNSNCFTRTHAHVKQRKVCKFNYRNSIQATFALLHEIGHIETTKSSMRRCESEFYATKWALEEAKKLGLEVPYKVILDYQEYIDREYDRGIRRHCNTLPPKESLTLPDVLIEEEDIESDGKMYHMDKYGELHEIVSK